MSNLPAGVPDPAADQPTRECPDCKGRGWRPGPGVSLDCNRCDGEGTIQCEPPDEYDHDEEEAKR